MFYQKMKEEMNRENLLGNEPAATVEMEFDAKFSFFTAAVKSVDRSAAPMDERTLLATLSEDISVKALRPFGIFVMLLPSRISVSIAAQAILPTSVSTAESVRLRPVQLTVTVVLLPLVSVQAQLPKSAAGGQRQTSFEYDEKALPF
jgi:hypothetical protein